VKIVAEHKADKTYPVVSAASIIAKVERDRAIALLRGEYGDFGSGYLADSRTTRFLRQWLQAHGEYPDCVRKSWKPAKKVKDESGSVQKKLA
jgi:ribonuclease HII